MIKVLLTILLVTSSLFAMAQKPFHEGYDWDPAPKYSVTPLENEDLIALKNKNVTEFVYMGENALGEYSLEHHVFWVNSDEKIEQYNRVYLPFSSSSELLVNKARVITKEGKVITLDDSHIFTAVDEETKQKTKYYAFEGLEKGSFIEYFYVVRSYARYSGTRISMQHRYRQFDVSFELYSPTNLWFKFKSFNGLPEITYDSTHTETYRWTMSLDTVPALEKEDQSAWNAERQYLIYKLYYNASSNTRDISSYSSVSQRMYEILYEEPSKSAKKKIKKLLKELKVTDLPDDYTKIRAVEDYLKKHIYVANIQGEQFGEIGSILDIKAASEEGAIKLYIQALKQMDIASQVVLTCNRFNMAFDKKFEATNYLSEYLLYVPSLKKYLSTASISSRLGYPDATLTNNYGLFIKEVRVGEFNTGVGKIRFIKPIACEQNFDTIKVNVAFDEDDFTTTNINIDHAKGGYYAMGTQTVLDLLKEQGRKEQIDHMITFIHENLEVENVKAYNDNPAAFGVKPFRVTGDVSTDEFVEKAGEKYLFKVGVLIGPQMEMYQEQDRKLPVAQAFKRNYHREITVNIPDGYSFTNLDDINIDKKYEDEDDTQMAFTSTYKLEGNKLTIICDEYYRMLDIPVDLYESYRTVINGAADFNKITLVLTK